MKTGKVSLVCPACQFTALFDGSRFARARYKVKCKQCEHRFQIDLETEQNCRRVVNHNGTRLDVRHMLFDPSAHKWEVYTNACKGMRYDLTGVLTLIRTGLVTSMTGIRPPGSADVYKARDLAQLHNTFQELQSKHAKAAARTAVPAMPAATVPPAASAQDDDLDRSWYEMDCGEFFARKLKPVLTRDLGKANVS